MSIPSMFITRVSGWSDYDDIGGGFVFFPSMKSLNEIVMNISINMLHNLAYQISTRE